MRFRLLLVSLGLLGTGAWMLAPTMSADEQETCDLAGLYSGLQEPKSNWVKVDGRLLWEEAAEEHRRRSGVTAYFVPLVPRNWEPGRPVKVFVRVSAYEADELGEYVTVEGLIQPMGLPMDVRAVFEAEGPQPAESPIYIHHGTDPVSQRKFAHVVIAIGLAGIGGFFLLGKFSGSEDTPGYGSRAQARSLDEHIRANPEAEQRLLQQAQERESEIDRWMRERGMKHDAPAETAEVELEDEAVEDEEIAEDGETEEVVADGR